MIIIWLDILHPTFDLRYIFDPTIYSQNLIQTQFSFFELLTLT